MSQLSVSDLAGLPLEQRWRAQTMPVPVVVGLVRRDAEAGQQFLLINRKAGPYAGQWALVGGKWDFGEALAEAIEREVHEETGLTTRYVALRGVLSERVVPNRPDGSAAHFLLLLCDLVVVDGEAQEQAEGAVSWFTPAEIERLHEDSAIIASDYAMIAAFAGAEAAAPVVEVEMTTTPEGAARMLRFELLDAGDSR